jgi:hypothetical protein
MGDSVPIAAHRIGIPREDKSVATMLQTVIDWEPRSGVGDRRLEKGEERLGERRAAAIAVRDQVERA